MRAATSSIAGLLSLVTASLINAATLPTSHEQLLERNIAYQSPSKQVRGPGLSFDVAQVAARVKRSNELARRATGQSLDDTWDPSFGPYGQNAYQGNVTWEHGVASGDPFPGEREQKRSVGNYAPSSLTSFPFVPRFRHPLD